VARGCGSLAIRSIKSDPKRAPLNLASLSHGAVDRVCYGRSKFVIELLLTFRGELFVIAIHFVCTVYLMTLSDGRETKYGPALCMHACVYARAQKLQKKGNCWASPGDLISQLPDRQPSDRPSCTVRSTFTECSKKSTFEGVVAAPSTEGGDGHPKQHPLAYGSRSHMAAGSARETI
jgi:hypothetical protein